MTSYQSRIQKERNLERVFNNIAFIVLVLALIYMTLAYIGAKQRHEEDRVGLLTCTEFLEDLEASEAFGG